MEVYDPYLRFLFNKKSLKDIKERVEEKQHNFSGENASCLSLAIRRKDESFLNYILSFEGVKEKASESYVLFDLIENNNKYIDNQLDYLNKLLNNLNLDLSIEKFYYIKYAWQEKNLEILNALLKQKSVLIDNKWIKENIKEEEQLKFKIQLKMLNFD